MRTTALEYLLIEIDTNKATRFRSFFPKDDSGDAIREAYFDAMKAYDQALMKSDALQVVLTRTLRKQTFVRVLSAQEYDGPREPLAK